MALEQYRDTYVGTDLSATENFRLLSVLSAGIVEEFGLYLPLTGGTLTGRLTIANTGGQLDLIDTNSTKDPLDIWRIQNDGASAFNLRFLDNALGTNQNMLAVTSAGAVSIARGHLTLEDQDAIAGNVRIQNTNSLRGRDSTDSFYLHIASLEADDSVLIDENAGGTVFGADLRATTAGTQDIGTDAIPFADVYAEKGHFRKEDSAFAGTFAPTYGVESQEYGLFWKGASANTTLTVTNDGVIVGGNLNCAMSASSPTILLDCDKQGLLLNPVVTMLGAPANDAAVVMSVGKACVNIGGINVLTGSDGGAFTIKSGGASTIGALATGAIRCLLGGVSTGIYKIQAIGHGSMAQGTIQIYFTTGDALISASAAGSMARGYIDEGSIEATGTGAFASGSCSALGTIEAFGQGAIAIGQANFGGSIIAEGTGSGAYGRTNGAVIRAQAHNSYQFGAGTNFIEDSLQVGDFDLATGVHLLATGKFSQSAARVKGSTRETTTDTLTVGDDYVYFANTDGGAWTATLPAGVQGQSYRIINSGDNGNDLTVAPNGSEHIYGANSNFTLTDGESMDITYDTTDGWY